MIRRRSHWLRLFRSNTSSISNSIMCSGMLSSSLCTPTTYTLQLHYIYSFVCAFTFQDSPATAPHHHLQSGVWTNRHPPSSRGMSRLCAKSSGSYETRRSIGGWFGVAVTVFITLTKLATSSLVSGIGNGIWRVYHPSIYPSHSGPLSLAIPPWVGAMSTEDGFGQLWEETVPLKKRPRGTL